MAHPGRVENLLKHQYKKGESGNVSGRPKGSLDLTTLLRASLKQKCDVVNIYKTAKGKTVYKKVTNGQAIISSLVKKAVGGDLNAIGMVFDRDVGRPVQTNINENTDVTIEKVLHELKSEKDVL